MCHWTEAYVNQLYGRRIGAPQWSGRRASVPGKSVSVVEPPVWYPSKNEMSILIQFSPSAHLVHI